MERTTLGGAKRLIRLVGAALVVALAPVAAPGTPALAGTDNETFVSMISTGGDYIGGGTNRFYHPGNASITVGGSAAYVSVNVSGGNLGDYFGLEFAAPPGRIMVEGVYERAQRAAFREAGRPGIDVSGDGRGCNRISGRFEVKRIETDGRGRITSLWVVYEQHCEGGISALFGEVRYNVPGDGGSLTLGPRHVRWPDAERGAPAADAPVVVVNTSSSPVTVGAPSVDGPDAAAFPISANECRDETLAPGDSCIVWVDFKTTKGGENAARLVVREGGGAHEVPLRGWVLTGTTRFTMRSEQGDYIGQGETNEYTPDNAAIAVGGTRQHVGAWIEGKDGSWWSADFSPPSGEILAAGRTYTEARRDAFRGPAAGISISGTGRGCNEVYGEFTVREISISDGGDLEEVAIDYEQHCERPSAPALRGVLEYRFGGEPRPLAPDPSRPAPNGPGPDADVHARSVKLRERARKLVGRVRVADGTAECYASVPVRLQRRRNGSFSTIAKVVTDDEGRFKKRVRARRSLYRAIAPRRAGPDDSVCARAKSRKVWF